jgi:hypothetical protein
MHVVNPEEYFAADLAPSGSGGAAAAVAVSGAGEAASS